MDKKNSKVKVQLINIDQSIAQRSILEYFNDLNSDTKIELSIDPEMNNKNGEYYLRIISNLLIHYQQFIKSIKLIIFPKQYQILNYEIILQTLTKMNQLKRIEISLNNQEITQDIIIKINQTLQSQENLSDYSLSLKNSSIKLDLINSIDKGLAQLCKLKYLKLIMWNKSQSNYFFIPPNMSNLSAITLDYRNIITDQQNIVKLYKSFTSNEKIDSFTIKFDQSNKIHLTRKRDRFFYENTDKNITVFKARLHQLILKDEIKDDIQEKLQFVEKLHLSLQYNYLPSYFFSGLFINYKIFSLLTKLKLILDHNFIGKSISFITYLNKTICQNLNLSLKNTRLDEDGVEYISIMLKQNEITLNTLKLNLDDNKLNLRGAQYIANILENQNQIKVLFLSINNNNISDDGLISISENLPKLSQISTLNCSFNNNNLNSKSLIPFSSALKRLEQIKTLNLSFNNNNIQSIGFYRISLAIKILINIQDLQLSFEDSKLDEMSGAHFVTLISPLIKLKSLKINLSNNSLKGEGAFQIFYGFISMINIENLSINLENNQIADFQLLQSIKLPKLQLLQINLRNNKLGSNFSNIIKIILFNTKQLQHLSLNLENNLIQEGAANINDSISTLKQIKSFSINFKNNLIQFKHYNELAASLSLLNQIQNLEVRISNDFSQNIQQQHERSSLKMLLEIIQNKNYLRSVKFDFQGFDLSGSDTIDISKELSQLDLLENFSLSIKKTGQKEEQYPQVNNLFQYLKNLKQLFLEIILQKYSLFNSTKLMNLITQNNPNLSSFSLRIIEESNEFLKKKKQQYTTYFENIQQFDTNESENEIKYEAIGSVSLFMNTKNQKSLLPQLLQLCNSQIESLNIHFSHIYQIYYSDEFVQKINLNCLFQFLFLKQLTIFIGQKNGISDLCLINIAFIIAQLRNLNCFKLQISNWNNISYSCATYFIKQIELMYPYVRREIYIESNLSEQKNQTIELDKKDFKDQTQLIKVPQYYCVQQEQKKGKSYFYNYYKNNKQRFNYPTSIVKTKIVQHLTLYIHFGLKLQTNNYYKSNYSQYNYKLQFKETYSQDFDYPIIVYFKSEINQFDTEKCCQIIEKSTNIRYLQIKVQKQQIIGKYGINNLIKQISVLNQLISLSISISQDNFEEQQYSLLGESLQQIDTILYLFLNFQEVKIDNFEPIQKLGEGIQNQKRLQKFMLRIKRSNVSPQFLLYLCQCISKLQELNYLFLQINQRIYNVRQFFDIFLSWKFCQNIQYLNLQGFFDSDDCIDLTAQFIEQLKNIRYLFINNQNYFQFYRQYFGIDKIILAISGLKSLTSLHLNYIKSFNQQQFEIFISTIKRCLPNLNCLQIKYEKHQSQLSNFALHKSQLYKIKRLVKLN